MRKKKVFHAVISAMLTLSLAVPAVSLGAVPAAADEAAKEPIAVYDFEDGLQWFYNKDRENFDFMQSGPLFVKKVGDQIEGNDKDKVDANGFLYTGTGSQAKYALSQVSNQPVSAYDAERGTVFNLCKTYTVERLVKDQSAGIAGDDEATKALDDAYPEKTEVRKAGTYKSAITCSNPFAKLDQTAAVLAFWGKASAEAKDIKTAFLEFDKDTTAVNFCFDPASGVKEGEWHYYTYVISADKIAAYIDGKPSDFDITADIDGEKPADLTAFLKEAKIYLGASNVSTLETHEATRLDNVSFYNGSMTAEEVAALYEAEKATTSSVDVTKPDKFIAMDSEEYFTNLNEKNPGEIKDFNIKGHTVKGVAVAETKTAPTKAGIKLSENPFAGNRLTGASISFWLRNNVREQRAKRGDTTLDDSYVLSFIDQEKFVFSPKHTDKSKNDITTFNFKTSMAFNFKEGVLTDVDTGNNYSGMVEDTKAADEYVSKSGDWHFITLNINNNGVTPYYDGVKVEGYIRGQGGRFMDGYYVRYGSEGAEEKGDLYNPVKLYGMFGGDNNQRTTMMMAAFAYADMDIYFGYFPQSVSLSEVCSPIDVTRISCYNAELTDAEAKALYEQEIDYINAQPEYQEGKMGDMDGDGSVTSGDALIALQVAAKLTEETDAYHTYGDMDGDGSVTSGDALVMLQIAAKLVPEP